MSCVPCALCLLPFVLCLTLIPLVSKTNTGCVPNVIGGLKEIELLIKQALLVDMSFVTVDSDEESESTDSDYESSSSDDSSSSSDEETSCVRLPIRLLLSLNCEDAF